MPSIKDRVKPQTGLHLASLKSFSLPYLMPIAAGDVNKRRDMKDLILRFPLKKL